jgi:iron-sulfur cluster assembly protein
VDIKPISSGIHVSVGEKRKMITLTDSAAKKIKSLLLNKRETGIRPAVQGGGCSGFTYQLKFDNQNEKDKVIESHGVNLYIDPKSFLYLMGTQIDFVDELNQSGFKFVNPNAKRTCGCGESFSI